MFTHPIYKQALSDLGEYETQLAATMQAQLGSEWWFQFAHPQTLRDYVTAYDDSRRLRAMRTMLRDALTWAHNIKQAG